MGYGPIEIRQDEYPGVTSVPNAFIDRFMAQAPGEYVKIYLYLLRCLYDREGSFSFARAAQLFDSSEGDIRRALLFWEDEGLLTLEGSEDAITGISLCTAAAGARDSDTPAQAAPAENADALPRYPAAKIRAFRADEEISQMIFVAAQYLGHRPQQQELCCFYYWNKVLGFSPDLIIELVDLCVSDGAADISDLHRCALDWHDAGVQNAADARACMKRRRAQKQRDAALDALSQKVCAALGITGRALSDGERTHVCRWAGEWNFSEDLILEACRRTIANTHQASFDYAETILHNWHRAGITDMDGVHTQDEAYHAQRRAPSRSTPGRSAASVPTASSGRRSKYGELELLTMANI